MSAISPRAIWYVKGDADFHRIYVALGYPEPSLVCINKDGDEIWEVPTKKQIGLIAISPAYQKIYLYEVAKRGPNSIVCINTKGEILWDTMIDAKVSTLSVNKYADMCIVGTTDSQIIIFDGKGKMISSQSLEAWKNPVFTFFHKHMIISLSERGYLYLLKTAGNALFKKGKIDLMGKISKFHIHNGFTSLVDSCSRKSNILHVYDPEDESYFDFEFRTRIRHLSYPGKSLRVALINNILISIDEDFSFQWAIDIKERIHTLSSDDWGEYLLVGTDNFNLYMFDSRGSLLWVKNTAGKTKTCEEAKKGFEAVREEEVLLAEENHDCRARDLLIDTFEKLFTPRKSSPKEKAEDISEDEWMDETSKRRKGAIIKDFKPFAVEKKMVVKCNLTSRKGLPILLVVVENTTETPLQDIKIVTELNEPIFNIKKSPIGHEILKVNTAKTFAIRFIPTSQEGKASGHCQMSYTTGGEAKEVILKKFTLNNVWPDMSPMKLGDIPWMKFIQDKSKLVSERFTSLLPKHLIPVFQDLAKKRGFKDLGIEQDKKGIVLRFTSESKSYQYGLEAVIKPSPKERGIFLLVINLYSHNEVNLGLLNYMFMDELDLEVRWQEEKIPPPVDDSILKIGRNGRYRIKEPSDTLTVPAPYGSKKDEISIPIWMPEDKEAPEYHPAGHSVDFMLYDKYSDYYSAFFEPYPHKKEIEKKKDIKKETISVEPGKGYIYLFEESSPVRAFNIFKQMINRGFKGLYITREYPKKVINKYDLGRVPYLWLTNVPEKNALRPTDTEKVRFAFRKHVKGQAGEDGTKKVILLDGVEYLITHNTFSSILKLLQAIRDVISISKSTLLIAVSPAAFQDRELKLLEREADKVIYLK